MSKFIISGFYDEVSSKLLTQLETIKDLGESYLCPRSINGKNISEYTLEEFNKEVQPLLDKYGIKISTIGSPYGKVALDNEGGINDQLAKFVETVKICVSTGCKYIRIFSFFPPKGKDIDSCHDEVVLVLRKFLKLIEGTDIVLVHENEKEIYGDAPHRCIKLYKSINHPQFKLCYDASNYIQCGHDPKEAYEQTKEYTIEYHIKDCAAAKVEVPLGMGEGRYQELLIDLDKRGYEGFVTLEPHTIKYALARIPLFWLPFLGLALKGWRKTFRDIDKKLGYSPFKKVTPKDVFLLQYNNLKKMLENLA